MLQMWERRSEIYSGGVLSQEGILCQLWRKIGLSACPLVGEKEVTKRMCEASNKGWFNFAGLQVHEVTRLKELSTCDKCKFPTNVYVMIWPLQMQVCERCYSRIGKWGLTKLKHLLRFYEGEKV